MQLVPGGNPAGNHKKQKEGIEHDIHKRMKLYLIFDEIKRSEKNIEKQEETCFKNMYEHSAC